MRNALILLAVVALAFVGAGAIGHSVTFDIDYGLGAWIGVSLFWITLVAGAVVFIAGLVAVWLARASAVAAQRKLERELELTYERLRAAEARASAALAVGAPAADDSADRTAPLASQAEADTSVTAPH